MGSTSSDSSGPFARLDRVRPAILLVASGAVLAALLVTGLVVHATFAPSRPYEVVDLSDDFEGPDELLRDRSPGRWQVNGNWRVRDGAAEVVQASVDQPRFAVVDLGSSDGLVAATGERLATGWGLTFRYLDENNHWTVTRVPAFGGYVVQQRLHGIAREAVAIPLGAGGDGTELGVRTDGDRIEILVDGRIRQVLGDRHPTGGTGVGLVATAGSRGSRWTDFMARTTTTDQADTPSTSTTEAPTTTFAPPA